MLKRSAYIAKKYMITIQDFGLYPIIICASDIPDLIQKWKDNLPKYEGIPYQIQNYKTGELIVGGVYDAHDIMYIKRYQE